MAADWDRFTAFLLAARFDEVLLPAYIDESAPAVVRPFAFSVFLRAGDRWLRLSQVEQGDQLEIAVVDRVEHDASLVEDPAVTAVTVDLTPQVLGEVDSFRITEARGYLSALSDPAAGRVAGLMLTAEPGGTLLFDPLWGSGIRVLPVAGPDAWPANRAPDGVVRWAQSAYGMSAMWWSSSSPTGAHDS
ncbi:hypothetical protein OWR29_43485 [Actinoplanes sp. Pm04-4]|uniref:Uncharacterized protein n=1 Tax=Paractinoplanes pyxinae TaxID=2997416 RepID=A0ABT4BEF1_9ACTN|nr:hypothetical protein [Actinoplanes pyxinae]MCY1144903.1 hypothetical protein [Actinoplanes pyxinae]